MQFQFCSIYPYTYIVPMRKFVYFRFIRNTKLLPLPGISNLRRYFADFQVPEGYLFSVDNLLRIRASKMRPLERVVVIEFDGIHLRNELSYDSAEDKILGPHGEANTMLIRGLFKNYKVPVW